MTTFRRQVKNIVYNFSEAEVKVREATSNDVWGPSAVVMREIAEYTFNVEAYTHVMGMIWKRLNDHGKNWRHVYKSLVVVDYLVKNGSERVAQQCRDNIFSIQTLKDFQFIDKDGKDQGVNVREKAKELAALVKDKDRVKEERARARRSRDHLGDNPLQGISHDSNDGSPPSSSPTRSATAEGGPTTQNINQARPSNQTEEDIQLQLALQMSKEHQDELDRLRQEEEDSLRLAIELSKTEDDNQDDNNTAESSQPQSTGLLDFSDPWGDKTEQQQPPIYATVVKKKFAATDPWGDPLFDSSEPQVTEPVAPTTDPWGSSVTAPSLQQQPIADPWGSSAPVATTSPDDFTFPLEGNDNIGGVPPTTVDHSNPFNLTDLSATLPPPLSTDINNDEDTRIEDKFLGENGALVDLDALLAQPLPFATNNPFGVTTSNPPVMTATTTKPANPFGTPKQSRPTLNELINKPMMEQQQVISGGDFLPPPLIPDSSNQQSSLNPFS
ncbi:epsin-1-like isoform X2 [Dysidea avara]|uniref:epsin-1-like isoform X2 n=1 Tax=Dysidea avara TaxID=196820 RepID=UPI0033166CE2